MTENILSRAWRITDVRAAAALSHPLRRRLVLMLVGHERSVAEIAAIMRLDLKYLHYHVVALVKLGLLRVAHERSRPGRRIKVYSAVADGFFVPGRVAAAAPSLALHAELRASLAKVREPSLGGIVYDVDENHKPRMRFIGNPTSKSIAATDIWHVLNLSPAEALRLTQDISARLKACVHRDRGSAQEYLVHFALARRLRPTTGGARVLRRL
jgi:DNA-binding transcriptional ArsR family regulator